MSKYNTIAPGATIGVLGGGQLGRMFATAARQMGYRVHLYAPEDTPPARFSVDEFTCGAYEDDAALRKFADAINVATVEFENVPSAALDIISKTVPVRPRPGILAIAQNRLREKSMLVDLGIPTTGFAAARSEKELLDAVTRVGTPVIIKNATTGYDGKGQVDIDSLASSANVWQELNTDLVVVEERINLAIEFSVITARAPDGATSTYRPIVNQHRDHILDISTAPAEELPPRMQTQAIEIAEMIAKELDLVGLLSVEFFLSRDGRMLVNELAPRPHNSGHLTIEAHRTSQFEQLVRAITGLPLGSTQHLRYAAMANLLGELWDDGPPDFAESLKVPDVKLHLYGKIDARHGRKMGHLTATSNDLWTAHEYVKLARRRCQKHYASSAIDPVQ